VSNRFHRFVAPVVASSLFLANAAPTFAADVMAGGDAIAISSMASPKMAAKPMHHHRMARHHMTRKPTADKAMADTPAAADGVMRSGDAMAPAGSAMSGDK